LLATTSSGSINGIEAKVTGLFVTPNQTYDDSALRLPIALAQTLVRVKGAHSWIVLLQDTKQTDSFLQQFRSRFSEYRTNLEFIPWYERADFYNKTVALFSKQINVLRLIIALIIILTISNILIMNVLERTGEVGTLLAIGFRRSTILAMFVTEGLMLGLIGGLLGILTGYVLAELISTVGIPMPPPPGMEEGVTGRIQVSWAVITNAFLIALVTSLLAGIYPARKASRLQIVDALRHNI
jgi:putative ABC transport system permease protein